MRHPKLGASWEGFALEEVIRHYGAGPEESWFWATHGGGGLDLLLWIDGRRLGFEIKYTDQPRLTRSMHAALDLLKLDHLTLVYPGDRPIRLAEQVSARGLVALATESNP